MIATFFLIASILAIWKGSGIILWAGYATFVISIIIIVRGVKGELLEKAIDERTEEIFDELSSKDCVSCAEKIKLRAKKCRFCGEPQPQNEKSE